MGIRRGPVNNQSPGLAESAKGSYEAQLNQLTGGSAENRKYNSDDAVVYELMRRRGDEQAHHKGILETLDVLYKGLNESESQQLTDHLNKFGGIGNFLGNLVNLPKDIHTGPNGIHPWAIEQGYQYHSAIKEPKGLVRDMIEASEMPLKYRMHIGEKYMTEAVPAMKAKIDELLTAHPLSQEPLDLSSVRKVLAMERGAEGLPLRLPSGDAPRKEGGDELSQILDSIKNMPTLLAQSGNMYVKESGPGDVNINVKK